MTLNLNYFLIKFFIIRVTMTAMSVDWRSLELMLRMMVTGSVSLRAMSRMAREEMDTRLRWDSNMVTDD